MANTLIRANGKDYYVNYNMSAFTMLERTTGITVDDIMKDLNEMEEKETFKAETFFHILKAGLDRAYNTNHSDFEVFDFQDDLQAEFGFEKGMLEIMKIVGNSLVSEKQARYQENFIKAGNTGKKYYNNKKGPKKK